MKTKWFDLILDIRQFVELISIILSLSKKSNLGSMALHMAESDQKYKIHKSWIIVLHNHKIRFFYTIHTLHVV